MKTIAQKHLAAVRRFIRSHGVRRLRVPLPVIVGQVWETKTNLTALAAAAESSTQQHRDRLAELKRLQDALMLSSDTEDLLLNHIGRGIMHARNAREWTGTLNDIKGIRQGVTWAIESMPKKTERGRGHTAKLRRRFVRDAALAFVMAGFDTVGVNDDSLFNQWCFLLGEVCGLNLNEFGNYKAATRAEIGKTESDRAEWVKRTSKGMTRSFPDGCPLGVI